MRIEILDVETVRKEIQRRGWKLRWVIEQIGEPKHFGYELLRKGHLPEDEHRKCEVLRKLAALLGLGVPQILLTLEAKRVA